MSVRDERRSKPKTPMWFFIIMAALIICSAITLVNQQMMLSSIDEDISMAQERLKRAQEQNEALLKEQEEIENPDYVEKLAREELGMTREGELPYIYSHKQQ